MRKLRHRELTLDTNTTLLPNSSHPGFHLPLLLVSHTSSCLYVLTCCFSGMQSSAQGLCAHCDLCTRPPRACYATVRQVSPHEAFCTEDIVSPASSRDSSEGGHSIAQKKTPSVSANGALGFRFRSH